MENTFTNWIDFSESKPQPGRVVLVYSSKKNEYNIVTFYYADCESWCGKIYRDSSSRNIYDKWMEIPMCLNNLPNNFKKQWDKFNPDNLFAKMVIRFIEHGWEYACPVEYDKEKSIFYDLSDGKFVCYEDAVTGVFPII